MNTQPSAAIRPDETDALVRRAIANLRADGHQRQADAVQLLADTFDAVVDAANRAAGLAEAHRAAAARTLDLAKTGTGSTYQRMYDLEHETTGLLRTALDQIRHATAACLADDARTHYDLAETLREIIATAEGALKL